MIERSTLAGGATLAITGSGGSGAVTAGLILRAAAGRVGHYGLLSRSAGFLIRGGICFMNVSHSKPHEPG